MDSRKYKTWRAAAVAQGKDCPYCGIKLTLENSTVDHRVPKSEGGSAARPNRTICCEDCNKAKGAKSMEEWTAYRFRIAKWMLGKRKTEGVKV